jgi:hypothetical protein
MTFVLAGIGIPRMGLLWPLVHTLDSAGGASERRVALSVDAIDQLDLLCFVLVALGTKTGVADRFTEPCPDNFFS